MLQAGISSEVATTWAIEVMSKRSNDYNIHANTFDTDDGYTVEVTLLAKNLVSDRDMHFMQRYDTATAKWVSETVLPDFEESDILRLLLASANEPEPDRVQVKPWDPFDL